MYHLPQIPDPAVGKLIVATALAAASIVLAGSNEPGIPPTDRTLYAVLQVNVICKY